jgi:hypothetical protein
MKDFRRSAMGPKRPPWLLPLRAGAVFRIAAALLGYGFFASDDYRYALEPAWREVTTGETAPASAIRSVVFSRFLAVVMRGVHGLGVDDPSWLVRGVYLALALWSLLAIPGVYRLTASRFGEPAGRAAAWLMACEALVPRLSTRALIEMAAIPPLVWGLAMTRLPRRGLLAGALLGVACMLRFQVGLVALVAVAWTLQQRRFKDASAMAVGGLATLLTQGLIDLRSHGRFLATLTDYVAFNAEHASRFGRAPWFTYLVFLALLTLPPLTIWLARPLWHAARADSLVTASLAVFVVIHSVIPHKEERFVFSVLPLAFVLLGAAVAESRLWVRRTFWSLNAAGLVIATLSDGQHNIIDPLLTAGKAERIAIVGGYEVPALYAGGRPLERYDDAAALVAAFTTSPPKQLVRVIVSADRPQPVLPTPGLICAAPRAFTGDVVDRVLVWLNPQGYGRRTAKNAIYCEPAP